ncbi:MAG: MurR/RpiR family transcriptional regulator [Fusobacteriaceae bacterium]
MVLDILKKRIEKKKLNQIEKKISEYFQSKKNDLYFYTSREIAKELEISDTSIIRFVKSLGFTSFTEFKKELLKNINNEKITPNDKLSKNKGLLKNDKVLNCFIENFETNISKIFIENSMNKIEETIRILLVSKKKYIVGFKSTSGLASFFGLRLSFLLKNTKTYSENSSELMSDIIDIKKGDCLFLMAYPKYSKTYELLIERAKAKNAKIIVLTDKATSPVIKNSDIVLFLEISSISYFNSLISAQVLLEYLLTNISGKIGEKEKIRLSLINKYLEKNL